MGCVAPLEAEEERKIGRQRRRWLGCSSRSKNQWNGEQSCSRLNSVQIKIEVKLDAELTRWLVGNQVNVHLTSSATFWDGDNGVLKIVDLQQTYFGWGKTIPIAFFKPAGLSFGRKAGIWRGKKFSWKLRNIVASYLIIQLRNYCIVPKEEDSFRMIM